MNVIFLDFDGVVNTPVWDTIDREFKMNMPYHGFVNNRDAVEWIEAFCQIYDFNVVVSSDWRLNKNWRECLLCGGFMDSERVIDRTPHFPPTSEKYGRGHEIQTWLDEHPEVKNFLIVDDDISEMLPEHKKHIIHTDEEIGFTEWNFNQCIDKLYEGELKR